ncbi:hypothetical protein LEP1GSC170_3743 [Leptospira interrogans serovar Bataviae str. HAI135]|nr:hypothetical protein LEP1GSC170_3743 [Leptospira interrogans serovar Bataviae str. HAI135]
MFYNRTHYSQTRKKSMDQEFNFIFKLLRFNSKLRVQYSIGFTLFGTI